MTDSIAIQLISAIKRDDITAFLTVAKLDTRINNTRSMVTLMNMVLHSDCDSILFYLMGVISATRMNEIIESSRRIQY